LDNPPVGAIQLNPPVLTVGGTSPRTITVTGNTLVPASVANVNGVARGTTYVNATTLTFVATVTDQAAEGTLVVTVTNPPPGGGTSPAAGLVISAPTSTPTITSVSPQSIVVGSSGAYITLAGTGFTPYSVVDWNGTALVTSYYYSNELQASVPEADLAKVGTASVTVNSPTATPSLSNALRVNITNPPAPTLTSVSPNGGPINTAAAVTLNGIHGVDDRGCEW